MSIWHVIVLAFLLVIYLFPWGLAASRHHPQAGAIFALNLLLGWTLLGWVGALVWALVTTEAHRQRLERAQ
jgi:Superinfection immunity protein